MVTLRCKQNGIGKAISRRISAQNAGFQASFWVYFRKDALPAQPELNQRFLCGFALALRLVLALPPVVMQSGFRIGLLDAMLRYPHDIETRDWGARGGFSMPPPPVRQAQ